MTDAAVDARQLAREFVGRINAHDIEGILALVAADHRLIDSLGVVVLGREALRDGWREYFAMVPDYRITIERTFEQAGEILFVGVAGGTYAPHGEPRLADAWSTPAAWRALIRSGQVAEWQVYADNEPIRRCAARDPA